VAKGENKRFRNKCDDLFIILFKKRYLSPTKMALAALFIYFSSF